MDIALNYCNECIANSVGTYLELIWQDVWKRNGKKVFRHHHNMIFTIPEYVRMMMTDPGDTILNDDWFHIVSSEAVNVKIRCVKPVLQFPEGNIQLGYKVGTRGNGVDKSRWPKDLMINIATDEN